jgi:hypothetical protein
MSGIVQPGRSVMKRSFAAVLTAAPTLAAVVALAGCQPAQVRQSQAPNFDNGEPAYLSMSAGDRLGSVMVEDRISMARLRNEGNAYASVEPQFEGE